jgi:endonuclease/exonuclease/phosphatase (EEP) superfamily protein YafD
MLIMIGNIRKIILYALIIIGVCSLAGLLSDSWWFFDLFNHFRPQAFLSSSVLFLFALIMKDKKCIFLALTIIALNFSLMIERLYAFPASKNSNQVSYVVENTQTISVFFSNVLTSNSFHQSMLNTVSKYNPDIMVTTEIDETWKSALRPIQSTHPHSIIFPRADNFGMAIYSKLPFQSKRYDVGDYLLPLMVLDFDAFALIAAHPIPPVSNKNDEELRIYINKIAEIVRNTKKPVILVGDFNATIWSSTVNNLRGLKLLRTNQLGFAWTWPSGFWPLAVQIDHIFVRDTVMADFEVLPYIGSDHFPVKSIITIKNKNSSIDE